MKGKKPVKYIESVFHPGHLTGVAGILTILGYRNSMFADIEMAIRYRQGTMLFLSNPYA